MTTRHTTMRFFFCFLACSFACGLAIASAELQLGAQLASPKIAAGETTYIVIQVAGVESPEQPTIEVETGDAKGIRSVYDTVGSRTTIRNGQVSQFLSYRFHITGLKPGEYDLVGALKYDGKEYATTAKKLIVREQTETEKEITPTIEIAIEKEEIYIGEMLPLRIVFTTDARATPEFHNASPEVESNGFLMHPLNGIYRARDQRDGKDRHFLEGACEPLRTGDLTLGPTTYTLPITFQKDRYSRAIRKRFTLASEPLTIKVKPVPTEGKPESFSGTVGRFELDSSASPLKLKQGEPISLSLVVAGTGNLASIDVPSFTGDDASWKLYDPSRVDSRDGNQKRRNPMAKRSNSGRVTFNRIIVPLEPQTEIPPFEFSYFDPDTAQYQTLRTDAIPIEVEPDPSAVASSGTSGGSSDTDTPAKDPPPPRATPPVEEMSDILSIRDAEDDQKWIGARVPLSKSKLFWVLQAPPAGALLALLGLAIGRKIGRRERSSGWNGTYPPCVDLLKKLEAKPESARQFYDRAHQFIEAWHEQAPPESSARLDEAQLGALKKIRERQSFLAFGAPAAEADAAVPGEEQSEVIATLKRLPSNA